MHMCGQMSICKKKLCLYIKKKKLSADKISGIKKIIKISNERSVNKTSNHYLSSLPIKTFRFSISNE